MKQKYQRFLSLALAVLMVVGMIPATAFAEEFEEEPAAESSAEVFLPEGMEPVFEPVAEPEYIPEPIYEAPAEPEAIPEAPEDEIPVEPEESDSVEAPVASFEDDEVPMENEIPAEEPEEETAQEPALFSEGDTLTFEAPAFSDEGDYYGTPEEQLLAMFYGQAGDIYYSTEHMADHLNAFERLVYNAVKENVLAVAAGTRTSTVVTIPVGLTELDGMLWNAADLGIDYIIDANGDWNEAIHDVLSAKVNCDGRKVFNAVRADCPYEAFWVDSKYGWSSFPYQATYRNGEWYVYFVGNYSFCMYASASYRAGANTQVDATKTARVSSALANARSIVSKNSGLDDMSKMRAYVTEIGRLNTYNNAAASGGIAYGDPWQLVYVFDGDSTTNVVCEGYSRAFQYLCEISSFSKSIWVYPVTGLLGRAAGQGSAHMWNTVHIPGTGNLLVDATNCDSGFSLCLVEPSGSWDTSYYANGLYFTYDANTLALYSEEELRYGPPPAPATSGKCGENVTWDFTDGVLTISGTGPMEDYPLYGIGDSNELENYVPWGLYKEEITSVVVEEGVTGIGDNAFWELHKLAYVSLPSTLTSIGSAAFWASGITEINIPDSVTYLGRQCFVYTALTSIEVPASVKQLPYGCFADTSLTTITLHEGLEEISGDAFCGSALKEITIPASVSTVWSYVFGRCSKLESVTFLGDAPTIHETAFADITATIYYDPACSGWDAVVGQNLGGTLTWVSTAPATSGKCGENVTWDFTDGVLTISGSGAMEDYTFERMPLDAMMPWTPLADSITAIVVEEGVTTIGTCAFSNLPEVTTATLPSTLTSIGDYSFFFDRKLAAADIPSGVSYLGVACFAQTSLTSAEIPAGVTALLDSCFTGAPLTSVILHEGLTEIQGHVFSYCGELPGITIPESVTYIGYNAFGDCAKLESVTFLGDAPRFVFQDSPENDPPTNPPAAFPRTTATIYYYANRTGWEEAIKNSTDSTLTFVAIVKLAITAHPIDMILADGEVGTFSAEAEGAVTTVWQILFPNASEWEDMEGSDTPDINILGDVTVNGCKLRYKAMDADGNAVYSDSATLTVVPVFQITHQPSDQDVETGQNATFTVSVTGENVTYQWQYKTATGNWANCSSATAGYRSATLNPVGTAARNGYQYRCVIKDASGSTLTSEAATLNVLIAPVITKQPADQTVSAGEKATFTFIVSGVNLTYQWQYRTSATGTWANCSSATAGYRSATLTPVGTTARNGYQYRCVVKDASGNTLTSDAANLAIAAALEITKQPVSQTVTAGETAAFTVTASGSGLTYQWQYCTSASGSWTNCSSATMGYRSAALNPVGTTARNGYQYRCIVKDASGNTVTSEAATLTVGASFAITAQPANQTVDANAAAAFTVTASGSGLTYQWQYRTSAAGTWANCSSATSGYRSATLNPVGTTARNGYQYRCVVKDASGKTLTSEAATLTVGVSFAITAQPANQSVNANAAAAFTVTASGSGLTYQWQYRTSAAGTWANCSSATSGYRSATLKPVGTTARNGYQYRCVVKDASGKTLTSEAATLTVGAGFAITAQPANQSVAVNTSAVFTVTASGSGLTYQWQYRTSATGTWANCSSATAGYRSATLKPVGTTARNGYQYRCVVKDASGKTLTSDAATLSVH